MKLSIYIITVFIWSMLDEIPKQYIKKIDKEVLAVFQIEAYEKEIVALDETDMDVVSPEFNRNAFFRISDSKGAHLGYFYYGRAASKADEFDFLVIFDERLIIKKIKVLAYREDYGGEISSKRWLRQFEGYGSADLPDYGSDIKAISGATISAKSMTHAVNELLKNLSLLEISEQ